MFSMDRKVAYSDVGENGFADAAQIADYFQDCSCFHADSVEGGGEWLAKEKGLAWLLAYWQIVVDRYPVYGEEVKVCTQVYGYDRVMAKRNFMLYDRDGNRIAVANSLWFMLNVNTQAPVKLDPALLKAYDLDQKQEMDYAPRKVDARGIEDKREPFTVERFCIDTNQHMNNVWYLRHALRYLPEAFPVRQLRAEYRKAARKGDIIYPAVDIREDRARVLMADEAGEVSAVVEFI